MTLYGFGKRCHKIKKAFLWIYSTMFQEYLDPCLTLEHQTW